MQEKTRNTHPTPQKRPSALGTLLYRILSGFVIILLVGFAMFALLFAIMYFI